MPAYLTIDSATDIKAWSGLNVNIRQAIEAAGIELAPVVDNLTAPHSVIPRLKSKFWTALGRHYPLERDRSIAKQWSVAAHAKLQSSPAVKTVISTGAIGVAQLPNDYKTVIWADATFNSLRRTYPGYEQLASAAITSGDWLESKAYERSALVCFSSQWAADDAVDYYGVDRNKIAIIPFGSNCAPAFDSVETANTHVSAKTFDTLHVLFVGVDWHRKGGPKVLAAMKILSAQGMTVRLSIVGCTVPNSQELPTWVTVFGFLNKHETGDAAIIDKLFRTAHLLCVPSTAECYGLVYAEASAYAVPSIANRVGGVPSVVESTVNGHLISPTSEAGELAQLLRSILSNHEYYRDLALSSYKRWASRLNWKVAGASFVTRLRASFDGQPIE